MSDITSNITPAPATPQTLKFEFKGDSSEFFQIWIVNVMLTIVTLGIYSAWAKVRTRRYFLGNTVLAGASFDYHGNPIQILKGRMIMAFLFVLYSVGSKINIGISIGVAAFVVVMFPWLVVRGMAFNLGNTSYRNLRFGFTAHYGEAYSTYFTALVVAILSLGLAMPTAIFRHAQFRISHARFGKTNFTFRADHGEFYAIYYKSIGIYLLGAIASVGAMVVAGVAFGKGSKAPLLLLPIFYGTMLFAATYYRARSFNLIASSTNLGKILIGAEVGARELFWLYLTNILACLATFGMLIPWALIRTTRFRLERTTITAPGLDEFMAGQDQAGGALADAATDFWDIDLGF